MRSHNPDTMIKIPMIWTCREAYLIRDRYINSGTNKERFDAMRIISDIFTDSIGLNYRFYFVAQGGQALDASYTVPSVA